MFLKYEQSNATIHNTAHRTAHSLQVNENFRPLSNLFFFFFNFKWRLLKLNNMLLITSPK